MKRAMIKVSGVILISTFLMTVQSCNKKSNPISPSSKTEIGPGRFAVSLMNGLSKASEIAGSDTTSFDLGDLRHSEYFYFLLSNDGQTPITNISLSTDDSMFQVSPQTITQLDPAGSGSSSIQPIIRIAAIHGTTLEGGIGLNPIMKPGINRCTLRITGKTASGDSTLEVAVNVGLKLTALVADFELYGGSQLLDPTKGYWATLSPTGSSMRSIEIPQNDTLRVRNTGNVQLVIKGAWQYLPTLVPYRSWDTTLAVGGSVVFQVPDTVFYGPGIFMSVDDGNTTPDPAKYRADANGDIYFYFWHLPMPPPPPADTDSTATRMQIR